MNETYDMPRVLLVDNDVKDRESIEYLLRLWGYLPILAVGTGKRLFQDAITKAGTFHCNLAIIDLRLMDDFDEEDISGLQLAKEISPTRSIILTGFPHQRVLLEILEKHRDIPFLRKSDSAEKKKETLDREAGKVCAAKRGLQIDPPDLIDQLRQTTFGSLIKKFPDQVWDILAQLLPGASKLRIERLDSSLFSTQASDVPRPKSVILRVYEEDYEPVVVKMARSEKIRGEYERYEQFIFRKTGGNFIAKLERHAELWDIGGALYTYIGDFDVVTFSCYFEDHPIEDIQACLDSFFTVSWGKHYDKSHELQKISLFHLYKEVWGDWYKKNVKDFSTEGILEVKGISIFPELPNPVQWFKKRIVENPEHDFSVVETTKKAITHGDLHGDNLLIDSHKNAWVIDFERSGEGHALQDFVELESDIINRLQSRSVDTSSYYRMCITVAGQTQIRELEEHEMESPDPGLRKALQTISILRSLAFKCTGISDARQYLLGLLFNTLFRATINREAKFRERQRQALILAGIFCHRLEHWNEPWPPEEWKPILNR